MDLLRHGGLRSKVGALLLPQAFLGKEETLATQLDVCYLDLAHYILKSLPEDACYLTLTIDKLIMYLDLLARTSAERDCVLVANFDVPLARLPHEHRMLLWSRLLLDFPYKRNSLILVLPAVLPNSALLPEGDLQQEWTASKRLVQLTHRSPSGI